MSGQAAAVHVRAHAQRSAQVAVHHHGRRREPAQLGAWPSDPHSDHVRVGARRGHDRVGALLARRGDRDPRLVDADHRARVLGQPLENDPGVAEPLW
jgi:hypothetical protein